MIAYLAICRSKAADAIAAETPESLHGSSAPRTQADNENVLIGRRLRVCLSTASDDRCGNVLRDCCVTACA
jgi:hypothetical protein